MTLEPYTPAPSKTSQIERANTGPAAPAHTGLGAYAPPTIVETANSKFSPKVIAAVTDIRNPSGLRFYDEPNKAHYNHTTHIELTRGTDGKRLGTITVDGDGIVTLNQKKVSSNIAHQVEAFLRSQDPQALRTLTNSMSNATDSSPLQPLADIAKYIRGWFR